MESAVAGRPWFVKAHAEHSGPNHKRNGPEPDGAVLGNSTLAIASYFPSQNSRF